MNMKSFITMLGILLIVVGVAGLAYQGITYTQREQVLQLGDLKVTADTQKTIYFPPVFGGLVLVAGIILVVIGKRS